MQRSDQLPLGWLGGRGNQEASRERGSGTGLAEAARFFGDRFFGAIRSGT